MKWQIFKWGLILEENTQGSLENRESKMEFFHKTLSSQYFFDWNLFWFWSLSFKGLLTDFGLVVTRLTEGNSQNQAEEPLFGGKGSKLCLCFPLVLILVLYVLFALYVLWHACLV